MRIDINKRISVLNRKMIIVNGSIRIWVNMYCDTDLPIAQFESNVYSVRLSLRDVDNSKMSSIVFLTY